MSGWSNNDLMMMASYGEYDGAFSVIVVVFVLVLCGSAGTFRTKNS